MAEEGAVFIVKPGELTPAPGTWTDLVGAVFLVKPGELTLKGGNRRMFEKALLKNLRKLLKGTGSFVDYRGGRCYVYTSEAQKEAAEDALRHLFGITGFALARKCEKTAPAILEAAVAEAKEASSRGCTTFKIESRRTDKGFPLKSYEICCAAGDAVSTACPNLKVDVHNPGLTVNIEIREKAFVYGLQCKGLRGLPVGTAGRGLLLLSGGIDSPVAGFRMLSRGLALDAVYFHAPPYTSDQALEKVRTLASLLSRYSLKTHLYEIGFTDVELRIKEGAPEEWRTVLLRMAMMECAAKIAKKQQYKAIVTGESLSQVASQTVDNMAVTGAKASPYPVFRPLVGIDKEEITIQAREIGTYETSILPYEDCCVLFSPPHPILRAGFTEANALYDSLSLGPLLDAAICGVFAPR